MSPSADAATVPKSHTQRLHSSGSLDAFNPTMVTPVIGNEFAKDTCNIVDDILHSPNADDRIRDLAIMSTIPRQLEKIRTNRTI